MAIKKFGPNSTSEEWVTLGEDITNEVIDIDVEEQLNQSFSATLTFDIDSEIGNSITYNDILVMPTNNIIDGTYSEEPFRVKKINKDIEYIEIYAEHRAFDIADNFIEYCLIENKPCTIACKEIAESTVSPHDITIESAIAGNGNIEIEDTDPMTALIGEENSIMATYDADIMFHENTITMLAERGEDRGVVIEYGRNLTGIDYTEDFTDTYTRIIATANNGEISLPEQYYDSPKINNYPHPIIRKMDFNEIKVKTLSSGKSKLSYEFISQEDGEVTFEVQLGKFGSGYKIHEVGIESVTIKNKDSNSSDDTNLITNGDFSNGLTDWTLVGISDSVIRRDDSMVVLPIANTTKSSQGSYAIKHHHIHIVKGATYSVSFTLNSTIERQVQVIINSTNKAYINEPVTIGSENDREGCESLVEAQNELRNRCEKLFTEDKVDEPTLTISVNLALLSTTEEYKNFSFEKMWVGDTVTVKYQKINLETSARCINTHFNPITKEVTELTIGTEESYFSNSVSDSIKDDKNLTDKIENIVNSDKVTVDTHAIVKEAVDKATAVMNNGLGGYVVKTRDELLVMDTDDVNTAKVITRMNKNGIAVSTTGYGGPWYGLVTGGKLVVNEATTEKFTAALINAGILKSVDGSSWFNLEDGTFSWANGQLTFDGTEFIVKIGDQTINDALDSVFNIVVNKEHQIITLDTNSFPIDNGNYSFTFTVLKGNTTTETPCIINRITPSTEIDGVSFTFKNNTCTMMVDKTKRFLGITGESFDVELEVLDYILHKTISWSTVLQGRDGKDGVNGTNGISSYFHVKYSPVANPTREQMSEEVNTYIGTYVDNIEEDSTDPESYTWVKLIGSDGLNGTDGIPGTNGTDGKTTYLHIKYSDDMVSFTDNNGETPGKYMGQYVDFIETDSLVFNDYIWAQIKGNDGRDGTNGTNGTPGVSSYFHVKYAPNNNPTASQMTDTPQEYMGTYVDSNRADSTDPKKYTWIKVLGKDGTSISIDYTVETLPTTGEVGKYYYVTGTGILWRYEESGWVQLGKIQGPQGIPGTNGEDGRTQYLHIKYSNDGGNTFTTNKGEDVGMYIGTYVDFEEADSNKVSDYKWARMRGEDGVNASFVKIVETSRLFTMPQGSTSYSPNTIALNPQFTNCTFGKWQYSTNGGSSWTNVTNGLNGLTISNGVLSISNTSELYTDSITSVSFKVTASDGSSDVTTITRLKDGVDGTDGTDGKNGTNGVSATNIILGNENHTFQATSDGKAVETSISFNIDGYVGTTEKAVTIGTISNIPTGMTITKNGSGTTNASLTVKVTTSMTKLNGIVTIPCTCNGLTINKQFTYSLSVPGKDGEDGINGTNGINGTSSYFHIKYAPNGNPTSAQLTETPNLYIGTYVDQSPTDSTDPSKYTWSKFQGVDGNNGKDGTPGKDGKDGTTYYLHIKYSNDGKTFTSNSGETPGDYLGQYVDTTKADSNDFSKYTWKRIKGDQGIPGADGSSSYFHIKYSSVASPTTAAQMTETPSDYIGTYVDDNPTDSTDPKKYTWSRFRGQDGNKGEQGTPGINGKDGKTYYLHIKYSNDGKTFTSNNGEDPGAWLGQYVDTTAADSTTFSKYTWSKIRGDDGANASYVNITATSQVFLLPKGSTSYTPSTIKLTPTFTNSTYSKWQYSTNNGSSWTNVTSGSNGLTINSSVLTIANTCNLFTSSVKSLQFKVTGTNGATDTMTVIRVEDGVDGNDGATGANGTSATNVQLSNENHTFQATSDGKAVVNSITVNIYGYTGTTLKSVTIGDIVGTPTGMTITKNNSGSTSASLSIATTTSMTTKNGTITIPLTCNGITFNKIFTYSLAVPGTDGTNGTNASYVTAEPTTLFFKKGSHETSYSPSTITITPVFTNCSYNSWQYSKDGGSSWTTVTSGNNGLTISSYKLTIANTSSLFTDSVTSIAFKVLSTNGKSDVVTISRLSDGVNGKGVNTITNYYLASSSSSGITTSSSGWTTTVQSVSTSNK